MNLYTNFKQCEQIIKIIAETGIKNFAAHDVSECEIFKNTVKEIKKAGKLPNNKSEILTNFLYLNAVMDQGRDPEGVKMLLTQVTNSAYKAGIEFLHNPNHFFENLVFFTRALREKHEEIKKIRAEISGLGSRYNLFDTRINPYTMHRWGTVMLCLKKLYEDDKTLLSFMLESGRADNIADYIRNDTDYGLGNAIGYKAARLLIKWIIHTFPIIRKDDLRWGPNSYEIPLDSNVGRVFMRSGILFLFVNEDSLWKSKCWIEQPNGKVNLSAQRLNELRISESTPMKSEIQEVLKSWGVRKRNIMKSLNAFILKLNKKGIKISMGQVDDGFMHIGQNFCKNDKAICDKCPLNKLCLANNKEPLLKTQYYCGVGAGVFFGR